MNIIDCLLKFNREVTHPLVTLTNIDPDDIPKDPSNRFLMRAKEVEDKEKDQDNEKDDKRKKKDKRSRSRSGSRERNRGDRDRDRTQRYGGSNQVDQAGRKIKGRGRIVSRVWVYIYIFVM